MGNRKISSNILGKHIAKIIVSEKLTTAVGLAAAPIIYEQSADKKKNNGLKM